MLVKDLIEHQEFVQVILLIIISGSTSQSPINLEVSSGTCDNSMVFDIQFKKDAMQIVMERVQYTIQSKAAISNLYATDINGNLYGYTATSFMFHGPSEHTIEGTRYDLEMQIVHELKVICFILILSLNSVPQLLKPQFQYYSKFQAQINHSLLLMTLHQLSLLLQILLQIQLIQQHQQLLLLPQLLLISTISQNHNQIPLQHIIRMQYVGSLTIPDCDENVNWYILDSILPITQTQLDAFNTYFLSNSTFSSGNGNNRAIQSTNDRTIKKGGVACEEQFVYFFSFFILYIFINYFIFKLL